MDLNKYIVTDVQNGLPVLGWNTAYRTVIKKLEIGDPIQGELFDINQGLDFQVFSDGSTGQAQVCAVSPGNDKMMVIDFATLSLVKDGEGNPLALATGNHSTDVKVQKVVVSTNPKAEKVFAFVSNAGDDTVTRIDTADLDPDTDWPQIDLKICKAGPHHPTALDTRGEGDYGFTANFSSASVSVIDLKVGACEAVPIPVGTNPLRIAIQPMYSLDQISKAIRTGPEYAKASDFTEPAKQPTLVRDWDAGAQLEATNADGQAVLANVANFERHVEYWVVKAEFEANLAHLSTLYRAQYGREQP